MTPIDAIKNFEQQKAIMNEAAEKERVERQDQAQQAKEQKAQEAAQQAQDDVVVKLSEESRELQAAKEAAEQSPDVRQEKVNELRQAVEQGQYTVDPDKVAEKMVGSIINEVA